MKIKEIKYILKIKEIWKIKDILKIRMIKEMNQKFINYKIYQVDSWLELMLMT